MSTDRTTRSDKELWRSLATEPRAASAPVSDMDFAAWLEGRLPDEAMARVEAAVAADPEMRRAALDLADVLGKRLPAPPPRMEVRAKALVGFEAERRQRGAWFGLLFDSRPFMEKSAMASLAIALAAVGFLMGGGLSESYAYQQYGVNSVGSSLTGDTTNELGDLFVDGN
jgi:anti-sigma factor RsiW